LRPGLLIAPCRQIDPRTFSATSLVENASIKSGVAAIDRTATDLATGPGQQIAANIKLISVCMRALPEILAGGFLRTISLKVTLKGWDSGGTKA
jgi:hypothetical protein